MMMIRNGRLQSNLILVCVQLVWLGAADFSSAAETPRTMRVDTYHTGNIGTELFSLHRVVVEPLEWPGNPDRPLDTTNRGKYFFEVVDPKSNEVLYSRGFSSIYGEWETTAEAREANRTFSESLRFPEPDGPVTIHVSKRNASNAFERIWTVGVDPTDMLVVRSFAPAPAEVVAIRDNGDPSHKVDLLILGDGYTADEQQKFLADAKRLAEALFAVSPFEERRDAFNLWAMSVPSPRSGVSRPSSGLERWTPVGTTYDAFRSERYVLTFDNLALRTIASWAPYDVVEILVNNETYGGGGIFGQYSTAAAGSDWAEYLVIHEFAHHFAGLADEYYTSPVAYEPTAPTVEPWEPNVTALLDPESLKWQSLVLPGTPVPTPWPKAEYESYMREHQNERARVRADHRPESDMNRLFRQAQDFTDELFSMHRYRDVVGAFEGANYEANGFYRPAMNCVMFTRHDAFCDVCAAAIERMIDLYTGR
ncbi:MAG TPA: M64 family metallopeptidase [Vicinamibacteria bacterium]|nr:M64 family metallopeptidase [Vicinamibacteria bacterium]